MDKDRALAAIGAIRHILDLDKRPYGNSPNPAAGEDAGNQIRIIRDNGPKSCHWKLVSLRRWLDHIFVRKNYYDEWSTPQRVKEMQGYALGILARIEAEVKK